MFFRNLLKNLPRTVKHIASLILALTTIVYGALVINAVMTNTIFVKDAVLPKDLKEDGLDGAKITERSIKAVPRHLSNNISKLNQIGIANHVKVDGVSYCTKNRVFKTNKHAILEKLAPQYYTEKQLSSFISLESPLRIHEVAIQIKKLMGYDHAVLEPSVREIDGQLHASIDFLHRNAKNIWGPSITVEAGQIQNGLSELLFDTFYPEIDLIRSPRPDLSTIQRRLNISQHILYDNGKSIIIKMQKLGYYANNPTFADRRQDDTEVLSIAGDIIKAQGLNELGEFRYPVIASVVNSVANSMRRNLSLEDESDVRSEKRFNSTVAPILKSMLKQAYVQSDQDALDTMVHTSLLVTLGTNDEEQRVEEVETKIMSRKQDILDDKGDKRALARLDVGYVIFLSKVSKEKFRTRIREIKNSPTFKTSYSERQKFLIRLLDVFAGLKTVQVRDTLDVWDSPSAKQFPCVALPFVKPFLQKTLVGIDRASAVGYKFEKVSKEEIAKKAIRLLTSWHENGFGNFRFYNFFGSVASEIGEFDVARDMYNNALDYPGDHSWAYLNAGNAAVKDGQAEQALDLYEKSLDVALIPNAVYGLLSSLYVSEKHKLFVQHFKRYRSMLQDLSFEKKKKFSAMLMKSACHSGLSKEPKYLVERKKLPPREEVVAVQCKWEVPRSK